MDTDVQGRFGSRWHLPPCSQPPYSRPPLPPRRGSPTRERRRSSSSGRRSSRPGRCSRGRPSAASRRSPTTSAAASTTRSPTIRATAAVRYYTVRGGPARRGTCPTATCTLQQVTSLLAPGGVPYPTEELDPEGLVLTRTGGLVLTSEGYANKIDRPVRAPLPPRWPHFGDLPVPQTSSPTADQQRRAPEPRVRERRASARHLLVRRHRERARPRTAPPRRSPTAARPESCATTCAPDRAGSASGSTRRTRWPSRPSPRPRSRVNGVVELLPATKGH